MQILDAKSGLSSNTAFNITQDDSGFIWIATPLGLDRFDGKSFKSYRADGLKGSLTSNTIRALAVDATNNIWVGTKGEGVFRFDRTTETFHQYKYDVDDDSSLSHNEVLSILEDSQGRLWVGTEDGLNLFDSSSNNFKRFTFSVNGEALRRSPVLNIYEDHHTNLWVGVWNGGLNLLIGQDSLDYHFENITSNTSITLEGHNVWGMVADKNDRFWIGSFQNGFYLMNEPLQKFIDPPKNLTFRSIEGDSDVLFNEVFTLAVSADNRLLVGTSNGMTSLDLNNNQNYSSPQFEGFLIENQSKAIPNYEIRHLFYDKDELLWVATIGGVYTVDMTPPKIPVKRITNRAYINWNIKDIAVVDSDNHYLATSVGLLHYNIKADEYVNYRFKDEAKSDYNMMIDLYHRPNSDLIYITTKYGLLSFNTRNQKFTELPLIGKGTQRSDALRKITPTQNPDELYIGTLDGLILLKLPNQVLKRYTADIHDPTKLSSDQVFHVLEADGSVYIATLGKGLNILTPKENGENLLDRYIHDDSDANSIPEDLLTCMTFNSDQTELWLGSDYGMMKYDVVNKAFSNDFNIPKSRISGIAIDAKDRVWFTSPEGIFCYDESADRLSTFAGKEGSLLNSYSYASYRKLNDGRMFFGGVDSYHLFRGEDVKFDSISNKVIFTDASVNEVSQYIQKRVSHSANRTEQISDLELVLSHDDLLIEIDFSLLEFYNAATTEYAHRLKGFDDDWKSSTTGRVEYSSLPIGTYTLEVKAKNAEGFWSEVSCLEIVVNPPFYKETWFVILAILLLCAAVYTYLNSRLSTILKSKKDLESVVKQRTRNIALVPSNDEEMTTELVDQILQENEAFYVQLFEQSPLGIIITDNKANVLKYNQKCKELLKGTKLLHTSMNIYEGLNFVEELQKFKEVIARSIEQNRDYLRKEFEIIIEGESRWLDSAVSLMRDTNGAIKYSIISVDDITERKAQDITISRLLDELEIKNSGLENTLATQNEYLNKANIELKSKNEELERFAFIASHDLKEPVRNINSYLTLIKMKLGNDLPEEVRDYFDNVSQSTGVMYDLITDVLEYSRVNREDDKLETVDLNDVIYRIKSVLIKVLEEGNVTLDIEDLPKVHSNGSFLFIVFKNIIENGIKFNTNTQPRISIKAVEENNNIVVSIADNGIGIPKEYQSKIFEMFERLHSKKEFAGTGLGLALCKRIMERLSGEIYVESREGEGSTFFITIPKQR